MMIRRAAGHSVKALGHVVIIAMIAWLRVGLAFATCIAPESGPQFVYSQGPDCAVSDLDLSTCLSCDISYDNYGPHRFRSSGCDGHVTLNSDFDFVRNYSCGFYGGGWADGAVVASLTLWVRLDDGTKNLEVTRRDYGSYSCGQDPAGSVMGDVSVAWSGVPEASGGGSASVDSGPFERSVDAQETSVRRLDSFPGARILDDVRWPGVLYVPVPLIGGEWAPPLGEWHSVHPYGDYGCPTHWASLHMTVDFSVRVLDLDLCPIASFTPTNCPACNTWTAFRSTSFDPDNGTEPGSGIALLAWEFSGDPVWYPLGDEVFVQWDSPGTYDVTLTVTDDDGSQNQAIGSHQVAVRHKKAVVLEATGFPELRAVAQLQIGLLDRKGWEVEQMFGAQASYQALCDRLRDPCVRGLVLIAHGGECADYVLSKDHIIMGAGAPGHFGPEELALCMPYGGQLEFLHMINCNVNVANWAEALHAPVAGTLGACSPRFADDWGHPLRPETPCPGTLSPRLELDCRVASFRRGENPYPEACPADYGHPRDARPLLSRDTDIECSSFAVCSADGVCGDSLFPVVECGRVADVPVDGRLSLTMVATGCRVEAYTGSGVSDSVVVVAQAFSRAPESFEVFDSVPLPQFLLVGTAVPSPAVQVDSLRIALHYTDDQVAQAGLTEQSLQVSWLPGDSSAARVVPAIHDLAGNTFTFTASDPAGVAGICYVLPTGSCCHPNGTCDVTPENRCAAPSSWTETEAGCTPNPCPQPPRDPLEDVSSRELAISWMEPPFAMDDASSRAVSLYGVNPALAMNDASSRSVSLRGFDPPFAANDVGSREVSLRGFDPPFLADDIVSRNLSLWWPMTSQTMAILDAMTREYTASPRECVLSMSAGINFIGPPLDRGAGYEADDLARDVRARVIIGVDSTGAFQAYVPDDPGPVFPVVSGHGYLAVCDSAHLSILNGITNTGTVWIRGGLDLISLPLDPDSTVMALALAQRIGASSVIQFDPERQEFRPFVPGFHPGGGFPIAGAVGYAIVAARDTMIVFGGRAWRTETVRAGKSLPGGFATERGDSLANPNAGGTTVLALTGQALGQGPNGMEPLGRPCFLAINARSAGLGTRASIEPATGRFSGALVDLSGASGLRPGDELILQLQTQSNEAWGEPLRYTVTARDLDRHHAGLGTLAISIPPSQTVVELSRPNPSSGEASIRYQLATSGQVSLRLYSVDGRQVRVLVDGIVKPGYYSALWDGRDEARNKVAAGVYFYKFSAPGYGVSHKLMVVR